VSAPIVTSGTQVVPCNICASAALGGGFLVDGNYPIRWFLTVRRGPVTQIAVTVGVAHTSTNCVEWNMVPLVY
jgi:hypothetical protein